MINPVNTSIFKSLVAKQLILIAGLIACLSIPLHAAAEDPAVEVIKQKLGERLPDINIGSLEKSAIEGLYELITDGEIYYVSSDGDYIVDGDMIDLATRTNLTSARKGKIHMGLINAVDEKDMLVYAADGDSNRSVTVFTDISCGYCRKLHAELDELLAGGVSVRYLMFPRAGLETQAAKDLESVWCAENPQEAMTVAKAGGEIVPKSCQNPIESHVSLAEQVGLRGTPLIYLDNGEMVPGYRPAKQLVEMINNSEPL